VERTITRLAGGFSEAGQLKDSSMDRTVGAIRALADLSRGRGVEKIFAVGTGVLREAKNGGDFLERVAKETGVTLHLLSGAEEGRLMLRGVLWSLKDKSLPRLVVDVGGWSTEILWVEGEVSRETLSLGLGAVALTERFLTTDPPARQELKALETHTRNMIREVHAGWERAERRARDLHPNLVGTAGTATTLAAIDLGLDTYDPGKINGHLVSLEGLKDLYLRLCSLPLRERHDIRGLEKGREDLIVAGALIFLALLETFELEAMEVIDSGLLEGVLLQGMEKSDP
jgi:exopolyphosphatase/guanosine-5'-triphosphate,3'-diphosphate pyrophosphatase